MAESSLNRNSKPFLTERKLTWASAFIKVNGTLEDKEEALKSAESFAKSIFARNLEKLTECIENELSCIMEGTKLKKR